MISAAAFKAMASKETCFSTSSRLPSLNAVRTPIAFSLAIRFRSMGWLDRIAGFTKALSTCIIWSLNMRRTIASSSCEIFFKAHSKALLALMKRSRAFVTCWVGRFFVRLALRVIIVRPSMVRSRLLRKRELPIGSNGESVSFSRRPPSNLATVRWNSNSGSTNVFIQ